MLNTRNRKGDGISSHNVVMEEQFVAKVDICISEISCIVSIRN